MSLSAVFKYMAKQAVDCRNMVRVKLWHIHTTVWLLKNYSQHILTYYAHILLLVVNKYNTRILLLDLTYGRTMVYGRAHRRRPDGVSAIRRCVSLCRRSWCWCSVCWISCVLSNTSVASNVMSSCKTPTAQRKLFDRSVIRTAASKNRLVKAKFHYATCLGASLKLVRSRFELKFVLSSSLLAAK